MLWCCDYADIGLKSVCIYSLKLSDYNALG